jgi:hypothetical protein
MTNIANYTCFVLSDSLCHLAAHCGDTKQRALCFCYVLFLYTQLRTEMGRIRFFTFLSRTLFPVNRIKTNQSCQVQSYEECYHDYPSPSPTEPWYGAIAQKGQNEEGQQGWEEKTSLRLEYRQERIDEEEQLCA